MNIQSTAGFTVKELPGDWDIVDEEGDELEDIGYYSDNKAGQTLNIYLSDFSAAKPSAKLLREDAEDEAMNGEDEEGSIVATESYQFAGKPAHLFRGVQDGNEFLQLYVDIRPKSTKLLVVSMSSPKDVDALLAATLKAWKWN